MWTTRGGRSPATPEGAKRRHPRLAPGRTGRPLLRHPLALALSLSLVTLSAAGCANGAADGTVADRPVADRPDGDEPDGRGAAAATRSEEGRPMSRDEASGSADTAEAVRLRHEMVERTIAARGVDDPEVLRAMREVPRHHFVPEAPPSAAYSDRPLTIGHGQTISQPYIVAFMAQAADVQPDERVLEIGTGSGYGAAVLGELAAEVYTVEIVPELARRAEKTLERTGYANVHVRTGNGWLGWPEHAPYDAVVVTAAPDHVPEALVEQLAYGGRLVIPVGEWFQTLRVLRKGPDGLDELESLPVRFVPMVGEPGDTAG